MTEKTNIEQADRVAKEKAKLIESLDLHDLTYEQRVECETLITNAVLQVGKQMRITDPERFYQARTKLCMYGLKLDSQEDLNGYSSEDLSTIATEVLERATAGANPTK